MKKLLLLLLLLPALSNAQTNCDSLWNVWNDPEVQDEERLFAMHRYAWVGHLFSNPDTAFHLAEEIEAFANEKGFKNYIAKAHNLKGISFAIRGINDSAVFEWVKCSSIHEGLGDKLGMSGSYNNIGNIYADEGNDKSALEYYKKSLKLKEEVGDKPSMAASLNNIAIIYKDMGESDRAEEYYLKALKIDEEINNNHGIAPTLNNLAILYDERGDTKSALDLYSRALSMYEALNETEGIARVLNNIASINHYQGDIKLAKENYTKALTISTDRGFVEHIAHALRGLGTIQFEEGNIKDAISNLEYSLAKAYEGEILEQVKNTSERLWEVYKATGRYKKSLEMHEVFLQARDSLERDENQRAAIELDYQFKYQSKAIVDSVSHIKGLEIKQAEIERQKAEITVKRNQQYGLVIGVFLILVFSIFMYNRFRITKKQKIEIGKQKIEIENTHLQLAEHHKEISDSIIYAKRIQEAIMPSTSALKSALGEGFVMYMPKDVVAGDFFWMEHIGDVTYYAAADCTGHGVPGAMVSVVCSSALNKALLEEGIRDPGKLLDRTREIVIERLAKGGDEVKDGMDISLCALNLKTKQLEWSGANNPIWIHRKGASELEETKPNKQPIGLYFASNPFTTHRLEVNTGDSIYVFTDGYQDQFGGPRGKKFKTKQLRELIIENQHLSMNEQLSLFKSKFLEWKGEIEQIDDVCIIGVRI